MPKRKSTASPPPPRTPKRPTPPDEIPRVVPHPSLNDHLEIMTRAIFQAGLSWAIITAKWDAFSAAFEQFDVRAVARYDSLDLERLMSADRLIHSAKKITGTFANARALLTLELEFGSVERYVAASSSYAELIADVRQRFEFMGDLNCYYWLMRTANPVPMFEDWGARQERDHPRMREMVLLARSSGMSSERAGF